eukprot:5782663-Pleurochrysis_carterae.AAC.1
MVYYHFYQRYTETISDAHAVQLAWRVSYRMTTRRVNSSHSRISCAASVFHGRRGMRTMSGKIGTRVTALLEAADADHNGPVHVQGTPHRRSQHLRRR